MLKDGYAKDLIFTPNAPILLETAELIKKIGLNVTYLEDAPPIIIETGEKFYYGTAIKDYSVFGKLDGCYTTKLADKTVVFNVNDSTISYK